jgi:hypothetical protein
VLALTHNGTPVAGAEYVAAQARFGRNPVGYAATALDGPRSVPDGFRELAEKEL